MSYSVQCSELLLKIIFTDSVNLLEEVQTSANVMNKTLPDGRNVYEVNGLITVTTDSSDFLAFESASKTTMAWYVSVSSNYVGSLFDWDEDLLDIAILEDYPNNLLSFQFAKSPPLNFELLESANRSFLSFGFTLIDSTTLTIYINCSLMRSFSIPQKFNVSNPTTLTLFRDASTFVNPAQVTIFLVVGTIVPFKCFCFR